MYILTTEILDYLVDNDFPVHSFIMCVFKGNVLELDKYVKKQVAKKVPKSVIKESLVSALVAYENNALLPLTKEFKIDVKTLKYQTEENENYNLLVSPLSSFTG